MAEAKSLDPAHPFPEPASLAFIALTSVLFGHPVVDV